MAELGGEQDLALKAEGPLDIEKAQADVNEAKARTPLTQAQTTLTGAEADEAQARTAAANAQLPVIQQQSELQQLAGNQALIANAAALIDPNDPDAAAKWDKAMQRASALGATDADQYVGRFTPALQGRVTAAYSAKSPLESAAGMQAGAPGTVPGGAGVNPGQDQTPEQLQTTVDNIPAPRRPLVIASLEQTQAAVARVQNSPNPAAQWDIEATRLGHPDWVGKYSPAAVAKLGQQIEPLLGALQGRTTLSAAGVGEPGKPSDIKEAGGTLYQETPGGPGQPNKVTPVSPQGQSMLIGTTDDGRGIFRNSVTGATTTGTEKLNAKPGTTGSGATGVFEQKRQAWLDVHPDDTQGALDYANGKGGAAKTLSPAQIQISAAAQASRDLDALDNSGNPPADPTAFLNQQTKLHADEYTAAQAAGGGGAGGGPGGGGGGGAPDPVATQRATIRADVQTLVGTINRVRSEQGPNHPWLTGPGAAALQRALRDAAVLPAMPNPGPPPPPDARAKLREGIGYPFANGQIWTLRNGQPVRVG